MNEVSAPDWRSALERLRGAYADESLRQARLALNAYERWCRETGRVAFPAAEDTLARAVDDWFERYAASTVRHRLWYLRWAHRALELPDLTDAFEVRLAFRRGARSARVRRGTAFARQATPIDATLRDRLLAACPPTLIGLRDRAMIAVGYDTLCRQGELVALRLEDLERLPQGGARLRVRRSKTDPFGRGDFVYLSADGLSHVDRWRLAARLTEGPILRGVFFKTRAGTRSLHVRAVVERLRFAAHAAGLPGAEVRGLTGHSMRVGAAQDLARAGRPLAHIMRAGRWRSLDSVALYVREAPVNVWSEPSEDGSGAGAAP